MSETLFDMSEPREKKEILMSIVTKQARKILDGSKSWEFRKNLPKVSENTDLTVVMYSAGKEKAIIGQFSVDRTLRCPLKELLETTGYAGDPEAEAWFSDYYKERNICTALGVGEVIEYASPILLSQIKKITPSFRPPQNFMYIQPSSLLRQLVDNSRD